MSKAQSAIEGIRLIQIEKSPIPESIEAELIPTIIDSQNLSALSAKNGGFSYKGDIEILQIFLPKAFNLYRGYCECGTHYDNNCAHFLTDAMVRAGLPVSFPSGVAKCPAGRMIRAKETLSWFRSFSSGFKDNHAGLTSGYWFVYQEYGGQGHVCIHQETPTSWYWVGTGDYPVWPVQWHYFY